MQTIGYRHVQPFHTCCALLVGALLCCGRGMGLAQHLDAAEVTHREYQEFILATGRDAPDHWDGTAFPAGVAEEPVTLVTWYDAQEYCAWRGKRLPKQDEWQRACQAPEFPKRGDIWEWTQSEEQGWKVLCGPKGTCDCSHRYRPTWKNAVKGFRCARDQPLAVWPVRGSGTDTWGTTIGWAHPPVEELPFGTAAAGGRYARYCVAPGRGARHTD